MTTAPSIIDMQPTAAEQAQDLAPVLDVAQSVLGKRWIFTPADERLAAAISQAHGLPLILGKLLASRGVSFDGVRDFLEPSLKSQLPDPSILKDMDKAAARIADAVQKGQQVAIFGDYDVDGATSSALLRRFLASVGIDARIYIPDRIAEGYGPNAGALQKLRADGADLVVTVDCGVTAFDAIAAGTAAGLDIVILDHHRAEADLPDAVAVVNPNRLDCDSGQGHMAAVGVVFLTIVAVNRLLRDRGFYTEQRPEPKLLQWLDLVALGTVCDVVPLTGVNRAFVAQGLRIMAMRQNKGIAALADVAGVNEEPNTFHAGFLLGPRVNAGGRIGDSGLGAELLSTEDAFRAREIAEQLHQFNAERRAMEQDVLEQAMQMAAEQAARDDRVLLVSGDGWHPGVIGIVAARLKEKYNRPACVVAFDDQGLGKSSGRSINVVDLGSAVISAKQGGLLVAGGGHKMAAGFTVARDRFEDLRLYLNNHVDAQMKGAAYVPELRLDHVLSVPALTLDFADKLASLAPYGTGMAEPRFALAGVKVARATVVGENHVSCFIQDTAGGASVKGIAFRALDTALGELLLKSGGKSMNLAGQVTINTWLGKRNVNFQISDASPLW